MLADLLLLLSYFLNCMWRYRVPHSLSHLLRLLHRLHFTWAWALRDLSLFLLVSFLLVVIDKLIDIDGRRLDGG